MNKINKILKLAIVLVILAIGVILINKTRTIGKITVENWDNIYNENNIRFYYSEEDNEKIKALSNLYSISEDTKKIDDKLERAIEVSRLLKTIIAYDVAEDSKGINGFDILREKTGYTTASARDVAIIYRDFLQSAGLKARVGEFRRTNAAKMKQKSYFVVEFWSEKYSKWIMIDFIHDGYFDNQGFPCSAIELLEGNIDALNYNGTTDVKKFSWRGKNINIKDALYTYTIAIDNTTDMKQSNTYITYVKDKKDIVMQFKGKDIRPTIYTQNKDLINKNPLDKTVDKDEKAYLVLMKKESANEKIEDNEYILGSFQNSKMIKNYYIKFNNDEFKKIREYSNITLEKGLNTIELSLDGENTISKIELNYK
ncbi:hypothetical protein [Caproiciproducens sp. MSJ-32]|uniref:hypothetical protein n=1 Tax=Caproiciproducens sp. MSJ-32 TaxID=2841527 RepID=UPI001C120A1D|nr:hypothetical protein [Caproiciproducens sp. MSJ-32]MBU5454250.1 hypothetical protein [Caproiciproducens sp. MSJ-32]